MKCFHCIKNPATEKRLVTLGWSGNRRSTGYRGVCSSCANEVDKEGQFKQRIIGILVIFGAILYFGGFLN